MSCSRVASALTSTRATWIVSGVVAAVAGAVYVPAIISNGFVSWDDPIYLLENPNIPVPFTKFFRWAFETGYFNNWHPLTWLSLRLDYQLWEFDPRGYHLTNALLHAVCSSLVVLLVHQLLTAAKFLSATARLGLAGLVGALFAVHPLHVESVVWVTERKDTLYAAFWLLSLLLYARYSAAARTIVRRSFYIASLFCFTLSLLAKPMAVTLPAVLLLLDWYPLRRLSAGVSRWRIVVLEKLPFVLLAVALSVVTVVVQEPADLPQLGIAGRVLLAVRAIGFYAQKFVLPMDLAPLYLTPVDEPSTWLGLIAASIAVATMTILSWRWRRCAPPMLALWAFFVLTIAPTLGIIRVGVQAAADRYMYLPMLGPLVAVGILVALLWDRWRGARAFLALAAVALVAAGGVLTIRQASVWETSRSLWLQALRECPSPEAEVARMTSELAQARDGDFTLLEWKSLRRHGAAVIYHNLGTAYRGQGDADAAIELYRWTLKLNPAHENAHYNLGIAHSSKGDLVAATKHYQAALRSKSPFPRAHFNLGGVLERSGDLVAAERHYRSAANQDPRHFKARVGLAHVLQRMGRLPAAIAAYQEGLRLRPNEGGIHLLLAAAYREQGTTDKAIQHYRQALRLGERDPTAYYNLGNALMSVGQTAEAIDNYQRALQLKPDQPDYLRNLATAFQRLKQPERAAVLLERLRQLEPGPQ